MGHRPWLGKPAEITFTSDFHEIVAGDLRPGLPVLLRYDPHRIIPPEEPYRFGDPGRAVIAHLQFHDEASPLDVALLSPAGVIACPDVDPTGQGSMLSAQVAVPADADVLIAWFSCAGAAGTRLYDSDFGANYRFGFPSREITAVEATVTPRPDEPFDRFAVGVETALSVEAASVPYVLLADRDCIKHEIRLHRAAEANAPPGRRRWIASIDVPHEPIVRYKVCYWIGGRRLLDDNAGAWYVAPAPEPDRPPPPTGALLDAAAAWR